MLYRIGLIWYIMVKLKAEFEVLLGVLVVVAVLPAKVSTGPSCFLTEISKFALPVGGATVRNCPPEMVTEGGTRWPVGSTTPFTCWIAGRLIEPCARSG